MNLGTPNAVGSPKLEDVNGVQVLGREGGRKGGVAVEGNGTEEAEPNEKELGVVEVATDVVAPNEKMELAGAVGTVDVVGSPKGAAVVVGTPKAGGATGVADVDGAAEKTGGAEDAPNAVGPPKLKAVEVLGAAELLVADGSSFAVTPKGKLPVAFPSSDKVNAGFGCSGSRSEDEHSLVDSASESLSPVRVN